MSTTLTGGTAGLVTSSSNGCNGTSTTAAAGAAGSITATFAMPKGTVDAVPPCLTVTNVEFTNVSATQQFSEVLVNWSTAREIGNERFEIERTASLHDPFETIGTQPGSGNSDDARDYSFSDSHPIHGKAYYRIRQVDTDGSFSYSEIAMVNYSTQLNFIQSVHPNPAAGEGVMVEFQLPKAVQAEISLMDATGRVLASHQMDAREGANAFELPLGGIADGLYFVVVSGAGFRDEARLMVFHP